MITQTTRKRSLLARLFFPIALTVTCDSCLRVLLTKLGTPLEIGAGDNISTELALQRWQQSPAHGGFDSEITCPECLASQSKE